MKSFRGENGRILEGSISEKIHVLAYQYMLEQYQQSQRQGYGKMLIEHSFQQAIQLGYDVVVIFGSPMDYVGRGFKSCRKLNVCIKNGKYPAAMMVKELIPNRLDGRKWFYYDSPAMAVPEEEAQKYDDTLEKMEKKHQPSQEEFYIMSHAFIDDGDGRAGER